MSSSSSSRSSNAQGERLPESRRPSIRKVWVFLGLLLVATSVAVALGVARNSFQADPLAAARSAYEDGDYARVELLASDHLRTRRDDAEARLLLARALARLQQDERALRIFQNLGIEQLQAEDFYLVGMALLRRGEDDLARGAFEQGEVADPNHPGILVQMIGFYRTHDDLERADDYARRLAALPDHEAAGLALQGINELDLHDYKAAAEHLGRAFRLDPSLKGSGLKLDEAREALARALLHEGRGDEAVESLFAIEHPGAEIPWLQSRAWLQKGALDQASQAMAWAHSSGSESAADPMAPEAAPFVGSARCAACHSEIYDRQQASRHTKTLARGADLHGIEPIAEPIPDPHNSQVQHIMKREGDDLIVETSLDDQVVRAVVKYVMGSGDKGLTLVGLDSEGVHRELRVSHYPDVGWDKTTGHPDLADGLHDYLGLELTPKEQRRCLGCHATDFHAAAHPSEPLASDRAIGCERCHGPGGNHVKAVGVGFPELAIGRPRQARADRVIQLCGDCHRPPGGGDVGPVGDPVAVRFQASTLVRSECYVESPGSFDCITCHDPHANAETEPAFYESICLACHAPPEQVLEPVRTGSRVPVDPVDLLDPTRRVPCPVNPRQDCVSCHMPQVKSGLAHAEFTDHHIRVRESDSEATDSAGASHP